MLKDYFKKLPKESAGRVMTSEVPLVHPDDSISDIINKLSEEIKSFKSINYVYVVDKRDILKGVISIKELFRQTKSKKVGSLMKKNLVFASPETDQEKVAFLSLKHNIKAVPILGANGNFLGAVLSDTILDIVYRESQEDISKLAGLKPKNLKIDDMSTVSVLTSLKHRLPWLLIGLAGGLFSAKIIGLFENTLAENIIIASFIPLIVYMAAAVENQISVFIIRDLAIKEKINFVIYGLRQLRVVFFIGLLISILVFLSSLIFYGELRMSLVLMFSMFLAVLSSVITGILIPFTFSRLRFDPANASGPIATILQDIISVTIYLSVANILL